MEAIIIINQVGGVERELELRIVYELRGRYLPATHLTPEEWPEVEIESMDALIGPSPGATMNPVGVELEDLAHDDLYRVLEACE